VRALTPVVRTEETRPIAPETGPAGGRPQCEAASVGKPPEAVSFPEVRTAAGAPADHGDSV